VDQTARPPPLASVRRGNAGFCAPIGYAIITPTRTGEDKLSTNTREAEIAQLSARYGTPVRRHCVLDVSQATYEWREASARREEVVLFLRRASGNALLHTKDFYPKGAFRVPSGGVRNQESLLDAVHRETFEETGLQVAVERFLAVVRFGFRWQENTIPLSSYLFFLHELGGQLEVQDSHERITAFREVALCELESVAHHLENLPSAWREWGLFRAIPHRLAAELLRKKASPRKPESPRSD